jgi:hypothetical protein
VELDLELEVITCGSVVELGLGIDNVSLRRDSVKRKPFSCESLSDWSSDAPNQESKLVSSSILVKRFHHEYSPQNESHQVVSCNGATGPGSPVIHFAT